MTSPHAGWYSDPADGSRMRYWSGSHWTDLVSPAEESDPPSDAQPLGRATDGPTDAAGPPDTPDASVDQDPGQRVAAHQLPPLPPVPPPVAAPAPEAPAPDGAVAPGSLAGTAMSPSRQPFPPAGAVGGAPWQGPSAGSALRPGERLGPDGQILSGYGRRFIGWLVDACLVGFVAIMLSYVVIAATVGFDGIVNSEQWDQLLAKAEANPGYQPTPAETQALFGPDADTALLWSVGLWLIVGFINGVILVAASGQTIGDRLARNRKVRIGRATPGAIPALIRWLIPTFLLLSAPFLCLLPLLAWGLDHLWPAWDPMRRTWQDAAAGTVVERSDLNGPPRP